MLAAAAILTLGLTPLAHPDAFDRTWCETRTAEFRLVSDHIREDAAELVRQMLAFRPVAESYLPGVSNDRNPPLTVIVFDRGRDFRRALGGADVAGFMQPRFNDNLMVVGPDPFAHSEFETLLHEYTHYLLRTRTEINIPGWFDEGLASMLSSARVEADRVAIGELPATRLDEAIRNGRLSLANTLEAQDFWRWSGARRRGFYAWSWLLTHRLLLGQEGRQDDLRPAFAGFLAGDGARLSDALGMRTSSLERQLTRYLERHPAPVEHAIAMPPEVADLPFRCLDQREATLELALAVVNLNPQAAVRALRPQTESVADDVELWVALSLALESADDREGAEAAARHALTLRESDVAAAVRLAGALATGCVLRVSEECRARWREAVPILRRALRADPARQDAIFLLGLAYLYSGRAGDALNYLRIAYQRQPWAPHVNFYLGETYRLVGDVRARGHLERVLQWSPSEVWRRLAEAALTENVGVMN